MAEFLPAIEPGEAGFDAKRLGVLDDHFKAYVDDGRLNGWQLAVSRGGKLVHQSSYGLADAAADRPVADDTIWRLFSMTKPITSVAAMVLWERGLFDLNDPISRWLPEFAAPQVYVGGPAAKPSLVPATEPIRVWHLLTHTAGLTYGFHRTHVTDEIYRDHGFELVMPSNLDLAGVSEAIAAMPLAFNPGSEWLYSMATDILGRFIEVVAGKPFDEALRELVLDPLGMAETTFWVDTDKADRVAELYAITPGSPGPVPFDVLGRAFRKPPAWCSGGGGLLSTTADYLRFTTMLLRCGQLHGERVLAPKTVSMMLRNQLPGGVDLEAFGRDLYAEVSYEGVGFGLGFAVVENPDATKAVASVGEGNWGGAASTAFWVDPREDLSVVFMTQLVPSSTYPIRPYLRQLVYSALIDPHHP